MAVREVIESEEDFDYCFVSYSNFQDIKDPEFHELRQNYLHAREELRSYIVANS